MICTTSALDLFVEPALSTSVEKTLWCSYQPLSSLESGPLEFHCPGSSEYMDLSKTYLQLKLKVVKKDGKDIGATAEIATSNLLLHSLFKKIDVYLNDTIVTDTNPTYAYKAYIQTLMNFGDESKNTQLRTEMYYKDPDTSYTGMKGSPTSGYTQRKSAISSSKTVELFGRLHVDVFHQERYMMNNVSMKLSLKRSDAEFVLLSDEVGPDYRVVIETATLFVRKVKVSPSVMIAHAKVMQDGVSALYPINQTVLKCFAIPKGMQDVSQENLWLSRLPIRMLIALVNTTALNGSYNTNPFSFQHFDLNYLVLNVDGEQLPTRPFTPDFKNKMYTREYLSSFAAIDLQGRDKGFGITYQEFSTGNVIYGFDLSPDETAGATHFELPRQGSLGVHMKFSNPLPDNVTCLILAEFENVISVDKNRAVMCQPAS